MSWAQAHARDYHTHAQNRSIAMALGTRRFEPSHCAGRRGLSGSGEANCPLPATWGRGTIGSGHRGDLHAGRAARPRAVSPTSTGPCSPSSTCRRWSRAALQRYYAPCSAVAGPALPRRSNGAVLLTYWFGSGAFLGRRGHEPGAVEVIGLEGPLHDVDPRSIDGARNLRRNHGHLRARGEQRRDLRCRHGARTDDDDAASIETEKHRQSRQAVIVQAETARSSASARGQSRGRAQSPIPRTTRPRSARAAAG